MLLTERSSILTHKSMEIYKEAGGSYDIGNEGRL